MVTAQALDLADQYYADSRESSDAWERARQLSMTLSLLQLVQVSGRSDAVEALAGYNVGRRINHIQQALGKLRPYQTATAVPLAAS